MTILNPLSKPRCVFCFEEFNPGECEILSARDDSVLVPKPEGWRKAVAQFYATRLEGPDLVTADAVRICPHCGEKLPYNIELVQNEVIALVGERVAGKSHYIASLVAELRDGDARTRVGCVEFAPINEEVQQRYIANYYNPFILGKQELPGTVPASENQKLKPLVYNMLFRSRRKPSDVRGVNLVLFDAAGEQLRNQSQRLLFNKYVQNAAAIIFLVDPLTIPKMVPRIPSYLHLPPGATGSPNDLLTSVSRTYARYHRIRDGKRLPIPTAIAIGKSDLLKYVVDSIEPPPSFLRSYDYEQGFKIADMVVVNDEMRELLRRYDQPVLLEAADRYSATFYCSVSPAGAPADPSTHLFPQIEPLRCLDPLFWLLWKMGYIEAVDASIEETALSGQAS